MMSGLPAHRTSRSRSAAHTHQEGHMPIAALAGLQLSPPCRLALCNSYPDLTFVEIKSAARGHTPAGTSCCSCCR